MTLKILNLHSTAFNLFLNHRCYLQNTFFIPKRFLIEHLRNALTQLFFSIFVTLSRWCLLVQNNENISL